MPDSQIEHLKALLLKSEQEKIRELEEDIKRLDLNLKDKTKLLEILKPLISTLLEQKIKESRDEMASTLAPVIGEAIKKQIENSREEMVDAISPIIGPSIKKQVSEAKDEVADALYPVIGKTIRKSIKEAMKNLVDTINLRVNERLSLKRWWLIFKSKFTGVSPAEYFIAGTTTFEIYDILLIHRETGILLTHLQQENGDDRADAELIGGMLTAIQDFARDALKWEEVENLSQIQYMENQIYLDAMPHSILALVARGIPPAKFHPIFQDIHATIHSRSAKLLRDFKGDVIPFKDITAHLLKLRKKLTVGE
jgi:hypothetical protein